MASRRILIVEDEHGLASALAAVCRRLDGEPTACASGMRALDELDRAPFEAVVLDIGLPDMSGLRLLEKIRGQWPDLPVLIITAHANLENAVAAKKLGVTSYLVKPLDLAQVQETLQQLLAPGEADVPAPPLSLLIGASPVMQRTFVEISHACAADAPVLITGPTGTGKTHAARVIHLNSARHNGPFVSLQCSAFPEPLLESELFGHEKNAFTGALTDKAGHIERAAGGTLFLDEIADVSPTLQTKLLRFVDERTFTRVGGREDLKIDLRLIAATNKDLREEVHQGRFREDLFYRLHVLEIDMPALNARGDDIPALAAFFLGSLAPGRRLRLSSDALALLAHYQWPGNVRELRNALEHAVAVSSGPLILLQHLPRDLREATESPAAKTGMLADALERWLKGRVAAGVTYDEIDDELESVVLRNLLRLFGDKPTVLARELKMNRATLLKKRQRMGLSE